MEQKLEAAMGTFMEKNKIQPLSLKEVLEAYKHIELTEYEVDEALIWAKRRKEDRLMEEAKKEQERKNREWLFGNKWTTLQTHSLMTHRAHTLPRFAGKFRTDKSNEILYGALVYYFSEDSHFGETAMQLGVKNPSLEKGIMLAGNFGVGKSWMMELFQINPRLCYKVISAKLIADRFELNGEESQLEFTDLFKNTFEDPVVLYQKHSGLCIDDLGTEDIKVHYGNRKNVIGDLIELRYSAQRVGTMLHATTNLTSQQLTDFYGGRVVSRMREIFNFVEVTGEDRRK